MNKPFPRRAVLYQGCALGGIMNAIWMMDCWPLIPSTHWDGNTYLYDGQDGNYAAIIFEGDSVVGTLFDHDSNRSPFPCDGSFEVSRFFRGMPASHQPLADRCLMHWQSELRGESVPLITAAFWNHGEYLAAGEPWDKVWEHGAHVVSSELIEDLEQALAGWQNSYQFSAEEVAFARSLFERKMASPGPTIELTPNEVKSLESMCEDPEGGGTKAWFRKLAAMASPGATIERTPNQVKGLELMWEDPEGERIRACLRKLAAMGILMPKN